MRIVRIALGGGPGSGKTTVLNALQESLRPVPGTAVVFLPEVATFCFSHRSPGLTSQETPVVRQHYIYSAQILTEKTAIDTARAVHADRLVLLSDRGILDAGVYIAPEDIPDATGEREPDYAHYDAVLFFEGAADISNDDTFRIEADEEARAVLARAAKREWSRAPHFYTFPLYPSPEEKTAAVKAWLNNYLNASLWD